MHNADKYVFDRKLRMPDSLMSDAEPFPMPTRQYKEDYNGYMELMLPHREMWMDHLALTIGRDLQVSTEFAHVLIYFVDNSNTTLFFLSALAPLRRRV